VRLVLMGTPGVGKGTQAGLLAKESGACHLSTGDMLRDAARRGTRFGREAQRYMDQGRLVPDDVVIGSVAERLASEDCARGFILDGFPRTLAQARALDEILVKGGASLDGVVLINVPRDEVVHRLAGRRVCGKCGAMFHVDLHPPTLADRCDDCGGGLVQREDDREETIRRRLDVYARETAPVLEHYRAAALLHEVDGTGSRDEVSRRIRTALA
jgi:adenylate kinase